MYKEDGLYGGHVIKLGPGNDEAALEALRAFPGGLQIGGGITDENAKSFLDAGASHVIVTSYVFRDGKLDMDRLELLKEAVGGKDKIVLDLSCRRKDGSYFVVTDRWQRFTDFQVNAETLELLAEHCAEFLVHGVDVEGKRAGIEDELVHLLGRHCPIPVTYAGGVRSVEDLDRIRTVGGGKVHASVGSALDIFGGDLPYKTVVEWSKTT